MDQTVLTAPSTRRHRPETLRIGIVGAGFGGIGLAILLRRAGFGAVTILEKGPAIGGTWRDNTYPGAACDVRSHLYSYSFAPNPDWPARYSGQAEILRYIQRTAEQFGVDRLVRLNTAVTAARWDAAAGEWRVTTASGEVFAFDVFVPAVGQLSRPAMPRLPGIETFAGDMFHSAQWRHDVTLRGRRVAVIGSAASAVQFVPEVAREAGALTVFQRSANWILPRNNKPYGALDRALFRWCWPYRQAVRQSIWLTGEFLFRGLRTGSWQNRLLRRMALDHLKAQVPDPALRAKLTPNYEVGCKRILFSDDYLPVFARPNVSLETAGIARFTATGIETADGRHHAVDVAIFGTGFDVVNCLSPVRIAGRDGADLQAAWGDGPEAYLGLAVPDFPNLFMLYGPGTNLGSNSIIVMLEAQSRFIIAALRRLCATGAATLEVRPEAQARQREEASLRMAELVWSTGCGAWYEGPAGRVTANWYGSTLEYGRRMARPVWSDWIAK